MDNEQTARCLRVVLVAMILADEDVDPDEVQAAERAYLRIVGEALPKGELEAEAQRARAGDGNVGTCLGALASDIDESTQQAVLGAAFEVASADGFVLEEEDALLLQVGHALGMDDARIRSTLSDLMR